MDSSSPPHRALVAPCSVALSRHPARPDDRWHRALDRIAQHWGQAKVAPRLWANTLFGRSLPAIYPQRDFGNLRRENGHTERVATNARQAQHHLRQAYTQGQSLHIAATRFSSNGQSLAKPGGISLQLRPTAWGTARWVPCPEAPDEPDLQVPACMTWQEVQALAQSKGRAIAVLPENLCSTVGGTLSVGGGIGPASVLAGRQVDMVRSIRFIYPNGDARWISPHRDAQVFSFALGAQGSLGLIDQVLLATVPHRPFSAVFELQFRSLLDASKAAQDFCERLDLPESFSTLCIRGPQRHASAVFLELGFCYERLPQAMALLRKIPSGVSALQERIVRARVIQDLPQKRSQRSLAYLSTFTTPRREHRFLWNEFFFADADRYQQFIEHLERAHFPGLGNQHLIEVRGLAITRPTSFPMFPLSGIPPKSDHRPWSIALRYAVPRRDHAAQVATQDALVELQYQCHRLGGRMYRYGYARSSAQELRDIYGEDYLALRNLKKRLDPRGILNPGVWALNEELD